MKDSVEAMEPGRKIIKVSRNPARTPSHRNHLHALCQGSDAEAKVEKKKNLKGRFGRSGEGEGENRSKPKKSLRLLKRSEND